MRLTKFLNKINEAQFRKPIGMFHGSSDTFLRSILKNGVVPNPTEKVWQNDLDVSTHIASRESLEGSYWTSNMITASSSAWSTTNKFGGNKLFVLANISEQSAFADEDSVNGSINWAFADAASEYNLSSDAVLNFASIYYNDWKGAHDKLKNSFIESLHGKLARTHDHPVDYNLLSKTLDLYLLRKLAHAKNEGALNNRFDDMTAGLPEIPSVDEAERNWLRMRDVLTRHYTKTAYKQRFDINHTLRISEPVNYRGANKITGIIGEQPRDAKHGDPDPDWYSKPLILYYGEISQNYLDQYKVRIGEFPGLVDTTGNAVMQSEKREL